MPHNDENQFILKTEKKIIDDSEYTVSQFTGREAFKIKLKLVKILAPIISSLISNFDAKGKPILDSEIDFSKIGESISSLMNTMSEDEMIDFILRMLKNTRKDNLEITEQIFDVCFAGNLTTIYKVIYFVIQVNYPDFFQAGASIGNLTEKFQNQVLKNK